MTLESLSAKSARGTEPSSSSPRCTSPRVSFMSLSASSTETGAMVFGVGGGGR